MSLLHWTLVYNVCLLVLPCWLNPELLDCLFTNSPICSENVFSSETRTKDRPVCWNIATYWKLQLHCHANSNVFVCAWVRACVVDCGVMSLKWQVVYLVTHCSLLQRLLWRLLEKYANVLCVFIRCQLCKQFLNVYFKNNLLHRSLVYIILFNITPTCFDCFYNGYPQSQCYEFVFDFALCYYIYFHFVNFPVNPLLTCTLPLKAHLTMLSYRLMHILEYYV